jgi:hypothetical protein
LLPAALATVPRSESQPYGPGSAVASGCPFTALALPGVCFALDGSESLATLVIQDAALSNVPAMWATTTSGGTALDHGLMCGSATVPISPGASFLELFVGRDADTLSPGVSGAGSPCLTPTSTEGLVVADFG